MCLCGLLGGLSHWMYVASRFLPLSPPNTVSPSSLCGAVLPWWVLAGVQAGHSGHSKSCTSAWRVVRVHSFPGTHLQVVERSGNETRVQEVSSSIYSGLWSLIGTALFLGGTTTECNLHAAFEGLCYCHLRLPPLVRHCLHVLPV